ncbi:endonuclease/exonuclease/phosphatase family protein [Celeribacter sp. ASW11-22]|nr:endonuclease/exonuclease/phosphatase family protein [Celeribacter litoreus]
MLLRELLSKDDAEIHAVAEWIETTSPDVLLLTRFDTDMDGHAARAFAATLGYPYVFSRWGNSGMETRRDLDKDGRTGEPEDAQSYGHFRGQGGMVLLSRLRILLDDVRDFSEMLWRDLPANNIPADYFDEDDLSVLRLSSTGHWDVPIQWGGHEVHLLMYAATSPVFDGAEDRNGRRNADETRFWSLYLDGALDSVPPDPVILLGNSNLDPVDGEGQHEVMKALLANPRLQDPKPSSSHGLENANPEHAGDPSLDTADWSDPIPGNLRVNYVLPSSDLTVVDSGVEWAETDPQHGLVWVDIAPIP